jgi:hypothetical protein
VDEALAGLAAHFRCRAVVPDQELVQLTAAARAGGEVSRSVTNPHELEALPGNDEPLENRVLSAWVGRLEFV